MVKTKHRLVSVVSVFVLAIGGLVASAGTASAATTLCNSVASTGHAHDDHVFTVPIRSQTGGYTERCYLNEIDTRNYNKATVALQETLKRCYGYNLAVDGKFGPNTTGALRGAQAAAGADPDGKYGPASRAALKWPVRAGSHGGHLGTCERVSL
jgi:hypothetical protein